MAEESPNDELPTMEPLSNKVADVEPTEKEPQAVELADTKHPGQEPTTRPKSPSSGGSQSPSKELSTREKLERAHNYKEEGNAMFKEKRIKDAMRKYHNCLLYVRAVEEHGTLAGIDVMSTGVSKKLPPDLQERADKLKTDCYNNLAACLLQTNNGDPKKIISYCDKVLALSPDNAKATFRKGVAQYNLKDYEAAARTLAEAGKRSRTPDPLINKYMTLCQKAIKESVQKEKECYEKMFR